MSDPLFSPLSLSASGVLSSSTGSLTDSSCSSASSESSTSSASTRLSPLPETDEHDVGDVDVGSSWSFFNSFKEAGVGADDTELMVDLRDLGFTELEGDEAGMAEAGRTEDREVGGGIDGVGTERFEEAEAERFGMIEAERVGGVEAERLEAAEAEGVGGIEAERLEVAEAEGFGGIEAERFKAGGAETEGRFMEGKKCVTVQPMIQGADGCQVRSKVCWAERGLTAESSKVLTMVENLTESLGLSSSTDSEGEETDGENLGADNCLAIVAEERQSVDLKELGGMDESEGLTEEIGVVRRETLDPGMLDMSGI